jgi:hypothetical protein
MPLKKQEIAKIYATIQFLKNEPYDSSKVLPANFFISVRITCPGISYRIHDIHLLSIRCCLFGIYHGILYGSA